MPAVDIAMRRSLGDGFVDLLVASLRPAFERRDGITNIPGKVTDVKTAFSSWDNCMKASYCKWPVIAILVIGGLMIFSVLWCIIRCACCGLSCCCECFQCLKCCGECCGCCTPPGGRKNKYLDEPFIPPDPGYKSQDPMFATGATLPAVSHASAASDTPQFAQFRVSKKGAQSGNDDALPAMPSWEGSESKKVLVEEESVEMSDLKRPEAIGANQGLAAGLHLVSPNPSPGPHNPYSRPGSTAGSTGYFATPSAASDRYGQTAQGYGPGYSPEGQGYRQSSSPYGNQRVQGYHVNPGYGAAVVVGAAMGQSYGEQGGYGQTGTPDGYGRTRQSGYDSQGQQREAGYGSAPRRSAASPAGHGYAGHYEQNRPYAGAAPERQYSSDSMRPLRPTVSTQQRQYSDDSQAVSSPFSHVSGGFDFSTDDSRSVAQSTRGARGYAGRPSLSREQTQAAAYNGYRMY